MNSPVTQKHRNREDLGECGGEPAEGISAESFDQSALETACAHEGPADRLPNGTCDGLRMRLPTMYPSNMKALLLSQFNQLDIADVPAPVAGAEEILVRVAACGICGSDVHGYDGTSGRRIPPLVMGHEAAGIVAAAGSQVSRFAIGDRVTFDSTVYCGECPFCQRGEINLCDDRQVVGVSCGDYSRAGAFAEYVTVPERILYRLPENLSFADA